MLLKIQPCHHRKKKLNILKYTVIYNCNNTIFHSITVVFISIIAALVNIIYYFQKHKKILQTFEW